ncbi:MAG: glycosyltransferase family 2 protein [Anaeroplasma bactoclasticum]|nr:glycosyltransferase family 2 protein [Anaeroplasma bactoclasticum]
MIERLLTSINNQTGIDFKNIGIIIINDCSNIKTSKKLVNQFPNLNVDLLENKTNMGPGLTRQAGIDFSSAEYITFLDADDTYYSNDCLQKVLSILSTKPDIVLTKWMEEYKANNQIKNILHDSDIIYLHGKFIKRSYLIEKNIRFNSLLRLHEDSYFSTLLLLTASTPYRSEIITNYWRYRNSSLVRKQLKYHYLVHSFPDLLTSNKELVKELKNRNCKSTMEYLVKSFTYLYCVLCSYLFADKKDKTLQRLKKENEKEFFNYLCNNLEVFEKLPSNIIGQYMNQQIQVFKKTISNLNFTESWQDFITRLTNMYTDE